MKETTINTKEEIEEEIKHIQEKYMYGHCIQMENKEGKFAGFIHSEVYPEYEIKLVYQNGLKSKGVKKWSKNITKHCETLSKTNLNDKIKKLPKGYKKCGNIIASRLWSPSE